MVTKQLLHNGSKFDIYVIEQDGACEIHDFILSLPEPELRKMSRRIDGLKDNGIPSNTEQFVHEGNKIYALKTTATRIYGFFHGEGCFVLAVGFMKNERGGKKVERRCRDQAEALREALGD